MLEMREIEIMMLNKRIQTQKEQNINCFYVESGFKVKYMDFTQT